MDLGYLVIGETNGLKAAQLDKGPPVEQRSSRLDKGPPARPRRSQGWATVLQLNQGAPTQGIFKQVAPYKLVAY